MRRVFLLLTIFLSAFVLTSCLPNDIDKEPPVDDKEPDEKPDEKTDEELLKFSFYFNGQKIVIELEKGEILTEPEIETEGESYYWETLNGELAEFDIVYEKDESFFYKSTKEGETYEIYFEVDGEIIYTFKTHTDGKLYELPDVPEKEGLIPVGWVDKNGILIDLNKIYRANMVLNPKYEDDPEFYIKVSFYGMNFNLLDEFIIDDPDTVTAPEPENIPGFEFIGWFDHKGVEFNPDAFIEKNTSFYARYKEMWNVRITLSEYGYQDRVIEIKSSEVLKKPAFRSTVGLEGMENLKPAHWMTESGKIFNFDEPIERSVKLIAHYEFKEINLKELKTNYLDSLKQTYPIYSSDQNLSLGFKRALWMRVDTINAKLPSDADARVRFYNTAPQTIQGFTWRDLKAEDSMYIRLYENGKDYVPEKYEAPQKSFEWGEQGLNYYLVNNQVSFFKTYSKKEAFVEVGEVGRLMTNTLGWFSPEKGNNTSGYLKILGKAEDYKNNLSDPYAKFGKNAYVVSAPGMTELGRGPGLTIFNKEGVIVGSFSRTEKVRAKDGTQLNIVYFGTDSQNEKVVQQAKPYALGYFNRGFGPNFSMELDLLTD